MNAEAEAGSDRNAIHFLSALALQLGRSHLPAYWWANGDAAIKTV